MRMLDLTTRELLEKVEQEADKDTCYCSEETGGYRCKRCEAASTLNEVHDLLETYICIHTIGETIHDGQN